MLFASSPLVLLSGSVAQSVDHCSTFFADWQERHQSSCDSIQAETDPTTLGQTFAVTDGKMVIETLFIFDGILTTSFLITTST